LIALPDIDGSRGFAYGDMRGPSTIGGPSKIDHVYCQKSSGPSRANAAGCGGKRELLDIRAFSN
jgi:hypothetical protein